MKKKLHWYSFRADWVIVLSLNYYFSLESLCCQDKLKWKRKHVPSLMASTTNHVHLLYAKVCKRVGIRLAVKRKQVSGRYNIQARYGRDMDRTTDATLAIMCPYSTGRYSQPYQARTAAGVWDLPQSHTLAIVSRLLPYSSWSHTLYQYGKSMARSTF